MGCQVRSLSGFFGAFFYNPKRYARDGVVQGAALFKNLGRTLPLSAKGVKTAAVIGPNANLSETMAGYYGPSKVCGDKFPTVIDAVSAHLPGAKVSYMPGVPSVLSDDTANVSQAAALAKTSDIVVLVLGTDIGVACENRDAVNITFSDGQLALAAAVAAAAKQPITVVTLTATPLDLTPLLGNPKIGAILHAGQPSVQTLGIGDLLFGTHDDMEHMAMMARILERPVPPAMAQRSFDRRRTHRHRRARSDGGSSSGGSSGRSTNTGGTSVRQALSDVDSLLEHFDRSTCALRWPNSTTSRRSRKSRARKRY